MEDEVRPGFLPPRAPDASPAPRFESAQPPQWAPPAPPQQPASGPTFVKSSSATAQGPSSPLAITAIALASVSMLLLLFSAGVGYPLCSLIALIALSLAVTVRRRISAGATGRPGQARTAVIMSSIALGLAILAAIVWLSLEASGFSPQDLQQWLEDELDRQRDRAAPSRGEIA